jgi:hypothetical protein
MKSNKYIAYFTVLVLISGTMLPMWWTLGDWDHIEKHELFIRKQAFKRVVSTATKPQSIPAALKSMQSIPEKPCWRRCDQRINKIVYTAEYNLEGRPNGGGLNDRGYILGDMAELAGYLCATVEFPKPHSMLGTQHNHNKPISVNSTWTDYFNFTFYQDSSPAVFDLPDDMLDHPRTTNNVYAEEKYKDWLRIVTDGENKIVPDFQAVEAFSRLQDPHSTAGFVWIIDQSFYDFIAELRALMSSRKKNNYTYAHELPSIQEGYEQGGCDYSADQLPGHMQTIFDQVLAEIRNANEPHAKIGSFHIRRGDAINDCNTTLPRMKEYLDCTFNGTQAKARNITLLWSSDERDPAYRQAVQTIVEQDFDHIKLIDLDAVTLRKLEDSIGAGAPEWRLNNYYLFRIVGYFPRIAVFHLEQRRDLSCPHCTYLSSWNIWDS